MLTLSRELKPSTFKRRGCNQRHHPAEMHLSAGGAGGGGERGGGGEGGSDVRWLSSAHHTLASICAPRVTVLVVGARAARTESHRFCKRVTSSYLSFKIKSSSYLSFKICSRFETRRGFKAGYNLRR